MNEYDAFDQSVADLVANEGATGVPTGAVDELITATSTVRPLPRWLALIKEPPMRRSSAVAVGSPTVRLVSIALSTILLLVLAGGAVAGALQLAGSPALVVSADGTADYRTISAAVAAAEDGDRILIKPGTYAEAVQVIDKDVEIHGDGPADEIVVLAVASDLSIPDEEEPVFAFYLERTASAISGLTIGGPEDAWGLIASGQQTAPALDDLTLERSVLWREGAAGTMSGSSVTGHLSVEAEASPTISRSTLEACIWISGEKARPVLDDNDISGCGEGMQVMIGDGFSEASLPGSAVITGNRIGLAAAEGAQQRFGDVAVLVLRSEDRVAIEDNTFTGDGTAIGVRQFAKADISGNDISGVETGIWIEGDDAVVRTNTIVEPSLYGLLIHGSPTLEDNSVRGALIGLNLGASANPTLSGNTFCGNETDVKMSGDNPTTLDGNEVCDAAG